MKLVSNAFIALAVLLVLAVVVWFFSQNLTDTLLFVAGSALGIVLLYLDEGAFAPRYAEQGLEGNIVITRSILFLIALIPLGIFVISSSGSAMGRGIIIALVTGVLIEMVQTRTDIARFNARFLSQLKHPLSDRGVQGVVIGYALFWFLLVAVVINLVML